MALRARHRIFHGDRRRVLCCGHAQGARRRLVSAGVGSDRILHHDDVAPRARNAGRTAARIIGAAGWIPEVAFPGTAAARARYSRVSHLDPGCDAQRSAAQPQTLQGAA